MVSANGAVIDNDICKNKTSEDFYIETIIYSPRKYKFYGFKNESYPTPKVRRRSTETML